jgi:outer membrane protein assembly factor BamE (lipoprotein component of BamABCDE complex)
MVSTKERKNYNNILILISLLMILACGCSIGRVYMGSEIRYDPKEKIKIGSTTKGEILETFGPPEKIQKQYDGDIFVYPYLRKNSSKLNIEVPYPIRYSLFRYTRIQQKMDSLVILFDKDGIVKNYGFNKATSELSTF